MNASAQVRIGDEFNYVIADSNPRFRITSIRGDVVAAVALDDPIELNSKVYPGDYDGMVKDFLLSDVESLVKHERSWAKMAVQMSHEEDDFWSAAQPGQVLHLSHFGSAFIRGHVVVDDQQKKFVPTALVGDWNEVYLPRRKADGSIFHPYHVQQINERAAYRPNHTNFYEANPQRHKVDPTSFEEVDLTLPEPTAQEQKEFDREALLNALRATIDDYTISAEERIAKVRNIVS